MQTVQFTASLVCQSCQFLKVQYANDFPKKKKKKYVIKDEIICCKINSLKINCLHVILYFFHSICCSPLGYKKVISGVYTYTYWKF